ncbi:MAG: hypothetical protein GX567_09320 [Clostridia bacterium]|nr:hypothetical protein [Clostridia bacterium]
MAITFGTEYTHNNAFTYFSDCAVLDSTHIAVVFVKQDGGPYYDGIIKIGTISNDDEITWGDEYTFWDYSTEGYSAFYPKVEKLDTNKLVIAWFAPNGSRSVIATVSNDDEVAFGTRSGSGDRYFNELDLTVLSTTSFVIAGKDSINSTYYGTASVATVSGTDITYGSNYIFNEADTDYTVIDTLDSTHFVVSYKDDGGDDYGCSKIGVVSGTTITFGDEYVFNSANTEWIDNCAIDSTHFVISYEDTGNSGYGTAIIGTVSNGDEISYGSEYVYKSAQASYNSVCVLDSSTIIVSWRNAAKSGTFSGSTITFSSNESSHSGAYNNNALCKISSTYFLNVWGSSSAGKSVIGLYTEDVAVNTSNFFLFFN